MGTRSLTHVVDEEGVTLLTMYRQMDGYPAGHGKELATFLTGMGLVNGFNGATPERAANGMGCLAAQIVAHFKDGIGGFYLVRPSSTGHGEEYEYTVYSNGEGNIAMTVVDSYDNTKRFDNVPEKYEAFLITEGEE